VRSRLIKAHVVALVAALALAAPLSARAATLPPQFDDQPVVSLASPTAFAFTPDGRMLITTKTGLLRVVSGGTLLPTPALNLASSICAESERGLLGVAVDPQFASNRFVYLFYTHKKFGVCEMNTANSPVNRVSRFVLPASNVIDPATETVLVGNMPSPNGNHNAGDIQFGKDGFLYIAIGDGGCDYAGDSGCAGANNAARDQHVLTGKVLRITRDGGIPGGNPFQGADSDRCNVTGRTTAGRKCQETFAWGLRNPWRIPHDPNAAGTKFHINDVGQALWEEIDLGQAGADYGWNVREGHCANNSTTNCGPPPVGMTNPIFDYQHANGCASITGGAFVPLGSWSAAYDGAYLFQDLVCGKIFRLVDQGGGVFTATDFATDFGTNTLIDMRFGPHGTGQALYYITWGPNPDEIRRIVFTGQANRAPTALATADPEAGNLPLAVSFDGTGSSDPDGDPLTYEWDFGDGSPTTSGATTSHTYTTQGTFTATLTVRDGRGGVGTDTLRIDAGNNPPAPSITNPSPSKLFRVGETITLSGSATDPEDGTLPAGSFSWEVLRHHDTHTHPWVEPTSGNNVPFQAPAPEDLTATTNSYLEIRLTATDSRGLQRTITQDLDPRVVSVTVDTQPAGRRVDVFGQPFTAPATITSWDGWGLAVNAPDQQDALGNPLVFAAWSDGGARAHTITTPASPATYVATYTRPYARPKAASPLRASMVVAYDQCTSADRVHGPPLGSLSCSDPSPASDHLTVGTPDSNGLAAQFTGMVRLSTILGNASTPADEADVRLRVVAGDVREAAGLTDYTGELQASFDLRVTDRLHGPSGAESGTTQVAPFGFAVPCTATPGDPDGADCAVTTSADALLPGAVVEGKRAIWATGPLRLFDGGADGVASTSPNTLFATQGIFVP
jgi:glucose/arabinose dehydrogenase